MSITRRLATLAIAASAVVALPPAAPSQAYVTGHDALRDKPYVAGLRVPGQTRFFCTGTLVAPRFVLTAAHCVDGSTTASGVEVVIGDVTLHDSTDPAEIRQATVLHEHPKWGGDAADKNDVALVEFATPATIAPARIGVTPALTAALKKCRDVSRLQQPSMRYAIESACPLGRGKALGWGRTSTSAGATSMTLREVTPRIVGLPRRTFWRAKAGACPGDSGGPLFVLTADGSPRLIGVASYAEHGGGWFDWLKGDRCSTKGMDYYSDVSGGTLRKWMESVTRYRDHRR
jgi:secreted trypsin-like serine protease